MAKARKIEIQYSPRNWAKELHDSKKRWNVLVCHRRAGKTTACINHLIRDAIQAKINARFAYIAPTYKQAKAIAWDMVKHYIKPIPGADTNESELRVDFKHNNSRIQLLGSDNPDSLRGIGLNGVVFDEYSQQPASIFSEVVSKCLADRLGYAIWIGTPKGKNEFYRIYNESQKSDEWYGKLLTIDESLRNEEGETIKNLAQALDDDKKLIDQGIMTQDEFNQEWYCSFEAAVKGAYYANELNRARKESRITSVPWEPQIPVDTYWDLGVSDTMCIIFAQNVGKEVRIIDFYHNNGLALEHYMKYLEEQNYIYGIHNFPHDIKVKEMQTGKTRYEVVRGFLDPNNKGKISVIPDIGLNDGINAARAFMQRCWFDQRKCEYLLDALGSYSQQWDENKGMFRDNPLHNWASHPSDAYRYLAVGHREKQTIKHHGVGMSKYKPRKRKLQAVWE